RLARRRRGTENEIHRVRDAAWREGGRHAHAGSGARVAAALRNLALGPLRLAGTTEIKRTLERIAGDRTRVLPVPATATRP
ncbi:MAG: hypothetical protein ACRDQB_07210, partial [Thermocrispum sp.]